MVLRLGPRRGPAPDRGLLNARDRLPGVLQVRRPLPVVSEGGEVMGGQDERDARRASKEAAARENAKDSDQQLVDDLRDLLGEDPQK